MSVGAVGATARAVETAAAVPRTLSLGFREAQEGIRKAPIESFRGLATNFEGYVGKVSAEARAVFEQNASESQHQPCNLNTRSRFLFKGLNEGTILYNGFNPVTKTINLKFQNGESAGTMYGSHISAMTQWEGATRVEDALQKAGFDTAGLEIAKTNLILAESGTRILQSDLATPVLRQTMPVAPEVWKCDFGLTT